MPEEMRKGQSLWRDAWRRLRRNRFAMAGLVVVALMSLAAVGADWIIPYEADYGMPWILAQPPGFEHPAVTAEIRFDVGEAPVVPRDVPPAVARLLSEDGEIVYEAHEVEEVEYRVRVRKGKVESIQRLEGAEGVDRIEVTGRESFVQRLGDAGPVGERLRELVIERRGALPPELATEERILLLRVARPRTPRPERIAVAIREGRVASITRDGQAEDRLRLEGRHVREVTKDGEPRRLRHLLGTDLGGRDVLSRVVYGARISLLVGAVATLVSVFVGVVYGAIAGYLAQHPMTAWGLASTVLALAFAGWSFTRAGGPLAGFGLALAAGAALLVLLVRCGRGVRAAWIHRPLTTTGDFMMRVVDILDALPFMFLVILLMISYGRDIVTLFVALGLVQWLMMARIVRGQVLSLKEKEFVEAARMCGTGHAGILFRHLVPNTLGVVVVYATLTIPAVILQESFLAFIGLTVEYGGRTLDSWGSLVNQGRQQLTTGGGNWWVLVFPSLAMAMTLFSLNFLGDGLRDALDPKLKGRT